MNTRLGIALTGFAAVFALLALTPAGASFIPNGGTGPVGHAMAEVVHRDAGGELVSSHTVHNRLIDSGESLIINGTFVAPLARDEKPTLLCISNIASRPVPIAETGILSLLVTSRAFSGDLDTCLTADIDTATPSVAVMNATFVGGTNLNPNQTIDTVIVCSTSAGGTSRLNCLDAGQAFALIGINPELVAANDTVDIAYTFDLTTNNH